MKPRSLLSQSPTSLKLTTGCETLDECLRGGFPCDSLTEILSISTPSFPSRFAVSISSLDRFIYRTLASTRTTTIILAIMCLYKTSTLSEFENTPSDLRKRASCFFKISGKLKQLANKFGLAVVITNQVTDFVESSDGLSGLRIGNLRCLYSSGRRVVPALGLAWANCVNSRVFISRSDDIVCQERRDDDESGSSLVSGRARRRLDIVFSPHLPPSSCEFMITRDGICGVR
ncbi:BnaC03g12950D [Brassica napus]|uniref:BnaC03g12950D protein n=1 Tax=Brassica napus TaxID=3708 RepID=A0A078FFX4_BRANA|nr:BnaC03g12950D [Brassica napus]